MKSVRKRLTYANVMSSLAVFLVVAGGSALAATQLGKNTVGPKQLKENAVTAKKIKAGAVTAGKLAPGAVVASNINTAGLTVPNASHATTADTAGRATTADNATNAGHATTANTATSATNATNATNADTATTAVGPAAFAHVAAAGNVLASRGMTVTSSPTAGFYCISGIAFEPVQIEATADYWNGTPSFNTAVQAGLAVDGLGGTGCPAGTQAFVHGVDADADAITKSGFFVSVAK